MITIEKINYQDWANSWQVSNGEVELVVTGDVGPRVMHYGFAGGQNFFKEFAGQMGKTGEATWQPRGGHRVWIAPEDIVKSYAPDNAPVATDVEGDVIVCTGPVEALTGMEKKITVKMAATGTAVELIHQVRNAGGEPSRVAPWVLTMFAQGGSGIHGFPPRGTHPEMLEPTNPLVMWAFTHLDDPRWRLSRKYLVLRQDPNNRNPQKLGTYNRHTWGAYLLNGELFVKRYEAVASPAAYPDFGCTFETFTNADILELETLGPLTTLAPGESVSHTERWTAHRDVRLSAWTDEELDAVVLPLV
ncbi:MAG: hypothetical protein NTW28_13705 [Candidatus Solibacter sp.]|nr:hypothetical protein [Candidatus Solibacter sp.]